MHVDTDSQKLNADEKVFGRNDQKWVWPDLSQGSKTDCVLKKSRWNKLIFCMLVQIQEN